MNTQDRQRQTNLVRKNGAWIKGRIRNRRYMAFAFPEVCMCRELEQPRFRHHSHGIGSTIIEVLFVIIIVIITLFLLFSLIMACGSLTMKKMRINSCLSNLSEIGDALTQQEESTVMTGKRGGLFWASGTTPGRNHLRYGSAERTRDPRKQAGRIRDEIAYPVSTNMYALIHVANVNPANFICPVVQEAVLDENVRDETGKRFWDFKTNQNVSYSYQAPVYDEGDGEWKNPFLDADGDTVILADQNPIAQDGPGDGDGQPDCREITCWSEFDDDEADDASIEAMSVNHDGDTVNALKYDGSAFGSYRADIGYDQDCINTPGGPYQPGAWRDAAYRGSPVDLRGGKGYDCSNHRDGRDTFLVDTPENPANLD